MKLSKKAKAVALGLGLLASVDGCAAANKKPPLHNYVTTPEDPVIEKILRGERGKIINTCYFNKIIFYKTEKPFEDGQFVARMSPRSLEIYIDATSTRENFLVTMERMMEEVHAKPNGSIEQRLYTSLFNRYAKDGKMNFEGIRQFERDFVDQILVHEMMHRNYQIGKKRMVDHRKSEELALISEVAYDPLLGIIDLYGLRNIDSAKETARDVLDVLKERGIDEADYFENQEKIYQAARLILKKNKTFVQRPTDDCRLN